jgi:hypothetical protein
VEREKKRVSSHERATCYGIHPAPNDSKFFQMKNPSPAFGGIYNFLRAGVLIYPPK